VLEKVQCGSIASINPFDADDVFKALANEPIVDQQIAIAFVKFAVNFA
jgi:hypothetical protein